MPLHTRGRHLSLPWRMFSTIRKNQSDSSCFRRGSRDRSARARNSLSRPPSLIWHSRTQSSTAAKLQTLPTTKKCGQNRVGAAAARRGQFSKKSDTDPACCRTQHAKIRFLLARAVRADTSRGCDSPAYCTLVSRSFGKTWQNLVGF